MRAGIYARHSTDKQGTSSEDQIRRCQEFCRFKGYDVVKIYRDEALSGAHIENRPGINALFIGALDGRFDVVIAEDLSRISRDQADTANFFKKMIFLGVPVETVSEGLINELHIGLKSTMNALYLKDLAEKTHRGVIAAVLRGGVPGGKLYGYDLVHALDEAGEPIRGKRTINPQQAAIVQDIFAAYASGQKLKHICEDLNRRGIDAPNGGQWAPTTLVGSFVRQTGLLRQTLYNGTITFNKMQYRKHPETGKRLSVMRPESEWVSVPIPELAIVDENLFAKVQRALDVRSARQRERKLTPKVTTADEKREQAINRSREWRRNQAITSKRANAVFGGKLYCGKHGKPIVATYARHYSCKTKGCPNRSLNYDEVIAFVIDAISTLDRNMIMAHFDSVEMVRKRSKLEHEIAQLNKELEAVRVGLNKVIDALGRDARSHEIRAFFDDKSEQIHRLKLDISRCERELAETTLPKSIDRIVARHNKLVTKLQTWSRDPEAVVPLRQIIDRLTIHAIWNEAEECWERSCEVTFDFPAIIAADKRVSS
ncbi:recombinase family protein [Thalassospira tepidiphila]|uniref:recombinase family protein n=1 Tax=Thalassospira tepidiphila TaxID=393657 RepID=UPI001BD106D4|nr:recombinase family protein [Thalassospira tepidiphila]MBS8275594.1 recombinase family protein [Thalassospira tepidiphila]